MAADEAAERVQRAVNWIAEMVTIVVAALSLHSQRENNYGNMVQKHCPSS